MRAKQGQADDHADKPRMSLLQRLAAVGLGARREEPAAEEPAPRPVAARPIPPRPAPRMPERQEPVSEYAKRAPQGLDQHGRQTPVHNPVDDDQLEIPAFLRRQAN